MALRKSKKLAEITNTSKSKKAAVEEEPEKCYVTRDSEILDLRLDISDDELFCDVKIDMSELRFV